MALQVWLPLNKENDFLNRGLADITVTNHGATYDSNGKIGGYYLFIDNTTYLTIGKITQWKTFLSGKSFSIGVWIKASPEDRNNRGFLTITNGIRCLINNNKVAFTLYNKSRLVTVTSKNTIADDNWHHVAFSYNLNENMMSLYIDGELNASKMYHTSDKYESSLDNRFLIGWDYNASSYYYNGCLSDVRIYDHCLSPKEVKEISKGLVLHYLLNDAYIETTTNLFIYPTPGNAYSANWDKDFHKDAISVSGWSSGYNKGVGNPTTVYHAHWILMDGEPTMRFPYITNPSGQTPDWLGIWEGISTSQIPAGTTYTVSFDGKADVDNSGVTLGLYYKQTSSGSNGFHDGNIAVKLTTEWKRYSVTYTCSLMYAVKSFYFYGLCSGPKGNRYVRNVQLEIKNHATPYTKNSRNNNIAYDSSGYQNDGTITGTLTTSTDTPRYDKCTGNFGTSYITMPSIYYGELYTISFWLKRDFETDALTSSAYILYANSPVRIFSYNGSKGLQASVYYNNLEGVTKNVTVSFTGTQSDHAWHYYTLVVDNKSIKGYIDGNYYYTLTIPDTGTRILTSAVRYIGREDSLATGISDFRIYATALSDEDIKELYNTPAIIDNQQDLLAYEFVENSASRINKSGIINSLQLEESSSSDLGIYKDKMKFNQLIEM